MEQPAGIRVAVAGGKGHVDLVSGTRSMLEPGVRGCWPGGGVPRGARERRQQLGHSHPERWGRQKEPAWVTEMGGSEVRVMGESVVSGRLREECFREAILPMLLTDQAGGVSTTGYSSTGELDCRAPGGDARAIPS